MAHHLRRLGSNLRVDQQRGGADVVPFAHAALPDATLGASAYLVEAALALFATTQPWRVLLSVVLVGLALTSLALVLVQILLVHALCTLCLCSAAISWLNAWLGRHEIVATVASFT